MARYSHLFALPFDVKSDLPADEVPLETLVIAVFARMKALSSVSLEEFREAFVDMGDTFDTLSSTGGGVTKAMLFDQMGDDQRALRDAGWEVVALRHALGLNPMHTQAPSGPVMKDPA